MGDWLWLVQLVDVESAQLAPGVGGWVYWLAWAGFDQLVVVENYYQSTLLLQDWVGNP